MAHITLLLKDYYLLDIEINGFKNQSTGEQLSAGLLNEKISFVTKYWINDLSKKVLEEKTSIESLKTELIKKHGSEDEQGNISIPMWLSIEEKDEEGNIIVPAIINPLFISFQEEFNTLLQEEKELEYHEFTLDEFKNVETTENYFTFCKLIQVD
jgi:hypothetical protein